MACTEPAKQVSSFATIVSDPSGQVVNVGDVLRYTVQYTPPNGRDQVVIAHWIVNGEMRNVKQETIDVTMPSSCSVNVQAVFDCFGASLPVTSEPGHSVYLPAINAD